MFVVQSQNGLVGGYSFANALVVLDAADPSSLVVNATGLARWRDGSGEQNDVVAASGGEPLVTSDGVQFIGNRSLELAVPLFPNSSQAYAEWTMAVVLIPQNQAAQYDYASIFAPSPTAAGNPNFVFAAGGEWGAALGGGGFPRLGAVTENVPQLLTLGSSASRGQLDSYVTGTGSRSASTPQLDNGIWNFGLGYGMQCTVKLFLFFNAYLNPSEQLALRDQIVSQTGLVL